MFASDEHPTDQESAGVLLTHLPGPDRKRSRAPYRYRLVYQNPLADLPGCALLWEVSGGRQAYQIALERNEAGTLRLHCTCADAVYRAEAEGRFCKHVHGLIEFGRQLAPALAQLPSGSALGA